VLGSDEKKLTLSNTILPREAVSFLMGALPE